MCVHASVTACVWWIRTKQLLTDAEELQQINYIRCDLDMI